MFDLAQLVLYVVACASLFGLTLFLFRDQIARDRPSPDLKSSGARFRIGIDTVVTNSNSCLTLGSGQ